MSYLKIENLQVRYGLKTVISQLDLQLETGQCLIISGESGVGKTTLGRAIARQLPSEGSILMNGTGGAGMADKILFVDSWYRFTNLEGDRNFYYQQRYNHQQRKETVSIARELDLYGQEHALNPDRLKTLLQELNYSQVLEEQLFEISSGEHKKLQLIKALWLRPALLIIDQPYTGLDSASRQVLNRLLDEYLKAGMLILLSNDPELPAGTTHRMRLREGRLEINDDEWSSPPIPLKPIPEFLKQAPAYSSTDMIRMKDVSIHYEAKQVLTDINWEVRAGERWLLQGPNGSGKSTLLSLITADHPQAYANDIRLFGVQRGGGESIWDIKKKLGLISPELHWYFDSNATVAQSLASGFFDANGQYQRLRYSQKQQLEALLHFFDLYEIRNELLSTQPLGKQRLALLGRTIIKNPQLLVLDEPCQGLDRQQTRYFNDLIDAISNNGVTIIYVGHFESQLPSCLTHKLVLSQGHMMANGPISN
ncbi:ATP-binding cassette domain-containing protein [Niabella terrae]